MSTTIPSARKLKREVSKKGSEIVRNACKELGISQMKFSELIDVRLNEQSPDKNQTRADFDFQGNFVRSLSKTKKKVGDKTEEYGIPFKYISDERVLLAILYIFKSHIASKVNSPEQQHAFDIYTKIEKDIYDIYICTHVVIPFCELRDCNLLTKLYAYVKMNDHLKTGNPLTFRSSDAILFTNGNVPDGKDETEFMKWISENYPPNSWNKPFRVTGKGEKVFRNFLTTFRDSEKSPLGKELLRGARQHLADIFQMELQKL